MEWGEIRTGGVGRGGSDQDRWDGEGSVQVGWGKGGGVVAGGVGKWFNLSHLCVQFYDLQQLFVTGKEVPDTSYVFMV